MQRRITLAILGSVTAALLLTGLGTFVLTRFQVRRATQSQLRSEAQALLPFMVQDRRLLTAEQTGLTTAQRQRLDAARGSLKLADASVVAVGPDDTVRVGTLPSGLTASDLDLPSLRNGSRAESGQHGSLAWAAAASQADAQGRYLAIVLTRQEPVGLGAVQWLLWAGGAVLLVSVVVSIRLSRALIAPLHAADVATRRIADGDLSARVPHPDPGDDDELADLSRAINTMAETLERSRGLERQFLMSVSHDLRTPLTSIRGYAEAITDGAVADPSGAASVILEESRRLERLVRDLLDLAKLDARRFSLTFERVELAEAVTAAAEGFRRQADAAGLGLSVSLHPAHATFVSADRDRFGQVVANLLENGLRYASTALQVGVSADDGHAYVTVVDDGPGISPADLPHVFDRLYVAQAQPARKESGSGLGLAIARELVGAMGGRVWAAAGPAGVGTCMVVELPLAADVPSPPAPPAPSPPAAPAPSPPAPPAAPLPPSGHGAPG